MVKKTLSLLGDKPNIFTFPQSTIDSFKIDDSDRELFVSSVKIFLSKSKAHFTSRYVNYHVSNNFKYFDIARILKYPLPAVYNKSEKRGIVNITAYGRRSISNIQMRDLYTLVVYSHVCSVLSSKVSISDSHADPFCQFMAFVFLKMFSKKYGITGAYVDLIPALKFLVFTYVYRSFFNIPSSPAEARAARLAKFDPSRLPKPVSNYDLTKINDLLVCLSDNQITPGLNTYRFLEVIIRSFGTINLPFFEDIMRFSCLMMSSTINGNSYFPPTIQMYHPKLYFKVNSIIENTINKVM